MVPHRSMVFTCGAALIVMAQAFDANAQGFMHGRCGPFYGMSFVQPRVVVVSGYGAFQPNPYYPTSLPLFHSSEYVHRLYDFPTHPAPMQIDPGIYLPNAGVDPLKIQPIPSSAASQLKSMHLQAKGDQRLREQKWPEARAAYSSAVTAAPDRAESHLRLALCYVVVRRYDSAIRQMKRALFLDPTLPKTGEKLLDIFGPDSKIALTSIISRLTDWVKEDLIDSDRLFLMGVVLHFNEDPGSVQYFEAARRRFVGKDASHIALFLNSPAPAINIEIPIKPNAVPVPDDDLPKLNETPTVPKPSPKPAASKVDLRFPKITKALVPAPVPMPDL